MRLYLPDWIYKSSYGEQLLASHIDGNTDEVVERQVRRTLRSERFWRHAEPFVRPVVSVFRLTKFAWEVLDGQYRRARKKVHSGSNPASGAGTGPVPGAGTFNTPVFSGFSTITLAGAGYSGSVSRTFEDAGIRAGEVIAYRCWDLKYGLLYSAVINDFVWLPGEVMEGKPTSDNYEGIYAFKDVDRAKFEYPAAKVTGAVHLWGDVYEHEYGYRASHAAIVEIHDSPDYDAEVLRVKYKINKEE